MTRVLAVAAALTAVAWLFWAYRMDHGRAWRARRAAGRAEDRRLRTLPWVSHLDDDDRPRPVRRWIR